MRSRDGLALAVACLGGCVHPAILASSPDLVEALEDDPSSCMRSALYGLKTSFEQVAAAANAKLSSTPGVETVRRESKLFFLFDPGGGELPTAMFELRAREPRTLLLRRWTNDLTSGSELRRMEIMAAAIAALPGVGPMVDQE